MIEYLEIPKIGQVQIVATPIPEQGSEGIRIPTILEFRDIKEYCSQRQENYARLFEDIYSDLRIEVLDTGRRGKEGRIVRLAIEGKVDSEDLKEGNMSRTGPVPCSIRRII